MRKNSYITIGPIPFILKDQNFISVIVNSCKLPLKNLGKQKENAKSVQLTKN